MANNTTRTNTGKNQMKEVGCLWKRVGKTSQEKYLKGTLNLKLLGFDRDVPVIVFSNKSKLKDTHPDLRIYLSEEKATGPARTSAPAAAATAPAPAPAAAEAPELI